MNLWRVLILLAALPAVIAVAGTEVRELSDFDRVAFALPGVLTLEHGAVHRITVDAADDDLERIETRVSGGELRVSWRGGFWNRGPTDAIRVHVVLPTLAGVAVQGSGDVDAGSWHCDSLSAGLSGSGDLRFAELTADDLAVTLSGSGGITVARLDAGTLGIQVNGSGDIALAGSAHRQDIAIRGSGDVDAADLEGAEVSVRVLGSGDVRVWASERLTATVRGSGDIRYRGDPVIQRKLSGSGELAPI